MTDSLLLAWQRYKYFPYERTLARREVAALFGSKPAETPDGMVVPLAANARYAVERLTYIRAGVNGKGLVGIPVQAHLESSALNQNAKSDAPPDLTRQQTRYSAHGIHEYRGKYNPQVVRVLGNIFDLPPCAWVLDPFCGSGTTLLECAHNGWNGVGVDANPLAVMIANAKVAAIREVERGLLDAAERAIKRIEVRAGDLSSDRAVPTATLDRIAGSSWLSALPNSKYLLEWFPLPVLAQAAVILQEIRKVRRAGQRMVLLTLLSDTLRDVSYQDPADLRIRRRENPADNYPLVENFAVIVRNKLDRVRRARSHLELNRSIQRAYLGDSRQWLKAHSACRSFDAVISSPPYANALPYIDTQRLSLCLLGLVSSTELRRAEGNLIGNREINRSSRDAGIESIERNSARLPDSVANLCRKLLVASQGPANGFRRQNTPSLVYRYFAEMAQVFAGLKERMKAGAPIAMIVGRNKTTLGGKEFGINTPMLLGDVACSVGLRFSELMELDAYFRFSMHLRNSIRGEALLLLRK